MIKTLVVLAALVTGGLVAAAPAGAANTNVSRWCGSWPGPFGTHPAGYIKVHDCIGYDWSHLNNHLRGYVRAVARNANTNATITDAHLDAHLELTSTSTTRATGAQYQTDGSVDFDTTAGGIGNAGYVGCRGNVDYVSHLTMNMRFPGEGDNTLYTTAAVEDQFGSGVCILGDWDYPYP